MKRVRGNINSIRSSTDTITIITLMLHDDS